MAHFLFQRVQSTGRVVVTGVEHRMLTTELASFTGSRWSTLISRFELSFDLLNTLFVLSDLILDLFPFFLQFEVFAVDWTRFRGQVTDDFVDQGRDLLAQLPGAELQFTLENEVESDGDVLLQGVVHRARQVILEGPLQTDPFLQRGEVFEMLEHLSIGLIVDDVLDQFAKVLAGRTDRKGLGAFERPDKTRVEVIEQVETEFVLRLDESSVLEQLVGFAFLLEGEQRTEMLGQLSAERGQVRSGIERAEERRAEETLERVDDRHGTLEKGETLGRCR